MVSANRVYQLFLIVLLAVTVSVASAGPVYFAGNGNYYEFVEATVNWWDALATANTYVYLETSGHLVTLTTAEENAFVATAFASGQSSYCAWIAAYEPHDDGVWEWSDGPENGVQFSYWATPTLPFNFANWGGVEPSNTFNGENYGAMNLGDAFAGISLGEWFDALQTPSSADPVVGFIVEYETGTVPVEQSSWGAIKSLYN